MDAKQKIEEKRIILNAMDKAIDKTFNENSPQIREEGRKELEELRGKDNAIPFFIGYAYEIEYYHTQDIAYAQKAINDISVSLQMVITFFVKLLKNWRPK